MRGWRGGGGGRQVGDVPPQIINAQTATGGEGAEPNTVDMLSEFAEAESDSEDSDVSTLQARHTRCG